ncbi:MAG: TolC family protein [Candidatus Omnitrophica bacterium]|nr:TolC family protein [Candidatus Omnitrophota bacterium]
MYRKIFLIIIFLNFSFFVYPTTENLKKETGEEDVIYPIAERLSTQGYAQPCNGIYLTLEEVSWLAISNNFDIQLAQFDAQFKETDIDKVSSIYDTLIEAEAKFRDNQSKSSSSFAGTRSETRDYNLGASQKFPTGTTLGLDFDNQRSWSNSGFVTVNPAYNSSAKLTIKQELGKNFFGIKDRSNIKITKIDIQNAQYTSLDKIEQMLSTTQKTYWKIALCLNVVKIRDNMLIKANELFQINKEKILKGIIEKPQLVASEANLRQKEIDLILAQNELEFHINELKLLLNLEDEDKAILPKENFDRSSFLVVNPEHRQEIDLVAQPIELSQALKIAFQRRRDYLRAKNEIDAKKIKLVMQENNLWPEINLEASISRNGLARHFSQAIEDISSEDNPEYFLSLKITFPLQNREARSEFNKAKLEKAKALLNFKKIERKILVEIKDNVRNCNILGQRAKKQKHVVKLQEEKLAAELKAYQYGRSDTDTVIRYQDDLLFSKLLYTQALLDYKEALIELAVKKNILLDRFWKDTL